MIHLIWRGQGYLVAVITFLFSLIANLLTNALTGGRVYWDTHKWPVAVSMFVAAAAVFGVGLFFLNRKARRLIDPATNEVVILRQEHSFFFIPIIWWSPILVLCALILLAVDFAK